MRRAFGIEPSNGAAVNPKSPQGLLAGDGAASDLLVVVHVQLYARAVLVLSMVRARWYAEARTAAAQAWDSLAIPDISALFRTFLAHFRTLSVNVRNRTLVSVMGLGQPTRRILPFYSTPMKLALCRVMGMASRQTAIGLKLGLPQNLVL